MADAGEILTVGEVRGLVAQMRATADDLEARLEGRLDDHRLPPLPVRLPWPWSDPIYPPRTIMCWRKPE